MIKLKPGHIFLISSLFVLLFALQIPKLRAQDYGNEWINLNQTYYRFSIPATGFYRITAQELQQAGITGSFSPQNIQLFYNGIEIPCYIEGESSGLITYIEFYAEKNSAWFDKEMYSNPDLQGNPYYSVITDTAAVFLTWNSSFNNKRYTVVNNTDYTNYTPASYCFFQSLVQYTGTYFYSYDGCKYLPGEGYVDASKLSIGATITRKIPTLGFVSNAQPTEIEWSLLSQSVNGHHLQVSGPGISLDTIYEGYKTIKVEHSITGQLLSEQTSINYTSINDLGAATDFSSLAYISITYPRDFNVSGLSSYTFKLPESGGLKTYLEFTNVDASESYLLYDITRGYKIGTTLDGTSLNALIPANDEETQLVLLTQSTLLKINESSRITFTNHANKNMERLIISHPSLWTSAQNYASYRNAYLIDVEELYNQFGYGIRKHPMAIRNFLNYALNTWSTKPNSLFIIGDGVWAEKYRNNTTYYSQCLVPPMGNPASDELLGSGFEENTIASIIPISRLAARNATEVNDYLAKIQEFEQNEPAPWMKQICHFGGGNTSSEQLNFERYLRSYEYIAEDSLFGGFVSTFLKNSSDPITISKTDSISNLINNGVSLMTFFGHGSSTGFDQNIDEPDAYANQSKYPLIMANSCYSGNIFLEGASSASDSWVLIPDKGAIGFLAMVNEGIDNYLNIFASEFYQQLMYTSYGEALGVILNRTKRAIQTSDNPGYYLTSTIEEFTLHGDPWIVLNSFEKPDLSIEAADVVFTPENITTEVDSFYMHIAPINQSRSTNKSFVVDVIRWFPDGSSESFQQVMDGLLFKDTISFKMPVDFTKGPGNNQFLVTIDMMNQVDELNEANNSVMVSTFVTSTDVIPVIPYKYAVWPQNTPVLKASTGDAFAQEQSTIFQIDTSYLFNSNALYQEEITHTGGVINWQPAITLSQNKPYYWRAAKKATSGEESWSSSSFLLHENTNGWHQSSIGQMTENSYKFIEIDELQQKFSFSSSPKTLLCHTLGTPSSIQYQLVRYSIDGIGGTSSCQDYSALIVAVIDSSSIYPWRSDYADFGHANYEKCTGRITYDYYFTFYVNSQDNADINLDKIVNLIESDVPDGFYFLIYSFKAIDYSFWSERHLQSFLSWGSSDSYRNLESGQPFIFFSQKGNPAVAEEVIGTYGAAIDLYKELKTDFTYGTITSTSIGPAKSWNSLEWDYSSEETSSSDEAWVKLYAENALGDLILLKDSITSTNYDISAVSAETYPNLYLQFYTRDEQDKTPAQLKYWQVNYEPVTDLAINAQRGWLFESDSLQEGEKGKLVLSFENIGPNAVDSVLVEYWIQDANNQEIGLTSHRISPLEPNAWTSDTLIFETLSLQGNNQLWVELNPEGSANSKSYDQNEQYHFNNLAQKKFYVVSDETNPLLDVTFDGVHIMDGDLVSSKPEISIQLTDENQYIALDDTALVSVYIKSQQTGIEEKIDLNSNSAITFIPANLPNNKAQIIYAATFPDDGTYELRVQAKDASGNESGNFDYNISFTVVNESTITQVFNYPNPFSTSTRFVFELTGSEIPDEMRIDILTISGKVVKVIYQEDLGLISIGKNISSYFWDGTDMYGDPLANGVYFYRVSARLNGEELNIRDTGTNQFFKNGFGKMYLMR
jgi:hypothetical protein